MLHRRRRQLCIEFHETIIEAIFTQIALIPDISLRAVLTRGAAADRRLDKRF